METGAAEILRRARSAGPMLAALKGRQAMLEDKYGEMTTRQSAARLESHKKIQLFGAAHCKYITGLKEPQPTEQAVGNCILRVVGIHGNSWRDFVVRLAVPESPPIVSLRKAEAINSAAAGVQPEAARRGHLRRDQGGNTAIRHQHGTGDGQDTGRKRGRNRLLVSQCDLPIRVSGPGSFLNGRDREGSAVLFNVNL